MTAARPFRRRLRRAAVLPAAGLLAIPVAASALPAAPASAAASQATSIHPGDLLVTSSVYPTSGVPITAGVTQLPPNCGTGPDNDGPCATAIADGDQYPQVFNNATVDGSFGVTSRIVLDELTPAGRQVGLIPVPAPTASGGSGVVTSFSSKSELAINQSTDGQSVSFMGYDAPVGAVDVSNADTPAIDVQSDNPATQPYYRVVAQLGTNGAFNFTRTNAFSGDNGRAAIYNAAANVLYMAGNADDASGTDYIQSTGAQLTTPSTAPESAQTPGLPTPVGSFSTAEVGYTESGDTAKDNNYRGLTTEDGVLYYSKGSGSQGIDSIYFVDTSGTACPGGVGVPAAGATLPTTQLDGGNYTIAPKSPPTPTNMCVLAGFPQTPNATNPLPDYPFGIWFANPDTLYVADEGNGNGPTASGDYSAADPVNNPTAGLQKWIYDPSAKAWHLAYTIQTGLGLGAPYTVKGYPTGTNPVTGLPWAPATDGLRNLTGKVNANGTVTLYATTSTVSGGGDQGADPNEVVSVTDQLAATSQPSGESFRTVLPATDRVVFRGVSFTPGSTPGGSPTGGTVKAQTAAYVRSRTAG